MNKISIYLNPHALNAGRFFWEKKLREKFFRHHLIFHPCVDLNDLKRNLQSDLRNKVDIIFSIGGDGTMNCLIQHLVGKKVKLLVIPAGTANDMAGELGIGSNINQIVKIYQQKKTRLVDVICINNKFMLTNGGIGLPQLVIQKINHYRRKSLSFRRVMSFLGKNIYSCVLFSELISKKPKFYSLTLTNKETGEVHLVKTTTLMVNNQKNLGVNFVVAPETKNDDGRFNVIAFKHQSMASMIRCIQRIRKGDFPKDDPQLLYFETTHLKITENNGDEMSFFGDGEILYCGREMEIKIIPQGMEMFSHPDSCMAVD